jgi:hypothetical protein
MKKIIPIALAVVLAWHFLIWLSADSKICGDKACESFVTASINPITDSVTLTIHETDPNNAMPTPTDALSEGFVKGFAFVLETAAEHKFNKAAHRYFDLYAMVFPYSVELNGLTKEEQTRGTSLPVSQSPKTEYSANETDTSQSNEPVTQPSGPAVTVSRPNQVLELTSSNGVCGVDYLNEPVSDGEETASLKAGKYEEPSENLGGESSVDVKLLSCVDRGAAEHALLATNWLSCGASCNSHEIVQVLELRGGHPVVVQQINFDSDARGTGATFDDNSRILTITARSNEESPHCCPKSLDVVTYRWEGQQFVQSSYKRVPAS